MHDRKLLAIDIGNSNIVFGLFEGKRLKWCRRYATAKGVSLLGKIGPGFDGIAVASVVPKLDRPLRAILEKSFRVKPIFVSSRIPLPIRLKVTKPWQLGADRIANAVAAYLLYGPGRRGVARLEGAPRRARSPAPAGRALPGDTGATGPRAGLVIVDFGTATTFDVISAKGEYLGGPIAPGIGIANTALHEKTAKLPLVEIARPARVIGKETVACIQSGVFYGYAGLVDGLVERIRRESGKKMRVIATGGLAPVIAPACRSIEKVDPHLTLRGLQIMDEARCR